MQGPRSPNVTEGVSTWLARSVSEADWSAVTA